MNRSPITNKIENALVAHSYQHANMGIYASFFCSVMIVLGLHASHFQSLLIGWFIAGILLGGCRLFLIRSYRNSSRQDNFQKWRNLFIFGASLNGLFWGFAAFLFLPISDQYQQILLLLTISGISAGGVPFLAAILPAAQIFLILSLMPLIPILFMIHHDAVLFFDFSAIVYLIYLINLSIRINKMITTSISLQFENQVLIQSLSDTKDNLEETNRKLIQTATHDPLTNVANRVLFKENFIFALQRAQDNRKIIALLYIDLDGFKQVNDTHGHDVGDQVLLLVVQRLKNILAPKENISRLGGDELILILEDLDAPQDAAFVAKEICLSINKPMDICGYNVNISASIGISIYPIDANDMDKLLILADKSMYRVKEKGGNNFEFWRPPSIK